MKQADAKNYIEKLGLEKAHNGIKRAVGKEPITFESEEKLLMAAFGMVNNFSQKYIKKYGEDYRVTMYILKKDGTTHLCYNDAQGINLAPNTTLEYAQGYAKKFSKMEDYILLVETEENCFSLVTQI